MVRGWGIPEGKEAGLRSLAYKGGVWLSPGRLVFTLEPALLLTGRGQLPWRGGSGGSAPPQAHLCPRALRSLSLTRWPCRHWHVEKNCHPQWAHRPQPRQERDQWPRRLGLGSADASTSRFLIVYEVQQPWQTGKEGAPAWGTPTPQNTPPNRRGSFFSGGGWGGMLRSARGSSLRKRRSVCRKKSALSHPT